VFGVETCSTTLDSFSALTSTPLVSENPYVSKIGTINDIVDLDPYTAGTLPNDAGTFIEWTVENLDGSKVNAFTLMVSSEVKSVGFAIGGENDESSSFPPVQLAAKQALAIPSRTKTVAEMPVGLAGFRKFRWSVTDAADVKLTLTSVHMAYCKGTGAACAAIDGYAAVGGGQISPAVCPEGYDGYSYRICTEGRFGDVQMDKCVQRMPEGVRFPTGRYLFVIDTQVSTGAPRFHNIVEKWSLEEGQKLPAGLTLNVQTGEISGIPTEKASLTTFTVVAENQSGSVTTTVNLEVRKGQCPADGLFPVTEVGVTAEYQCSTQGSFVGTQKRVCKLGEKDGEWEEITGVCVSVVTIVFVAIVVILVVVVVVFILIRVGRKTKASGGVKGKKKTMKKEEKGKDKKTKKSVKV
jgi:singapore isolate B (sub-type 7) whole genome shotgun sequence assembly, scaffold_3